VRPEADSPEPAASHQAGVTVEVCVREAVERYLAALDGHDAHELYRLVIDEVERPLLQTVMAHCQQNITSAACVLGINRATLRKKLVHHGLLGD
jgi:Fis family transcriptional regulator, factor for inversion stimulation protein